MADGIVTPRAAGTLTGADGDVAGEPGQHPARLGQAHLPAVPQKPRDEMNRRLAPGPGQLAGPLKVAETGEEGLDIEVAEHSGVGALVGVGGWIFECEALRHAMITGNVKGVGRLLMQM